eukprot:1229106-Pyramimonas_sp.AAC.1
MPAAPPPTRVTVASGHGWQGGGGRAGRIRPPASLMSDRRHHAREFSFCASPSSPPPSPRPAASLPSCRSRPHRPP